MLCSRKGEMLQVFSLVFNLASEGVRDSSAGWQHTQEKSKVVYASARLVRFAVYGPAQQSAENLALPTTMTWDNQIRDWVDVIFVFHMMKEKKMYVELYFFVDLLWSYHFHNVYLFIYIIYIIFLFPFLSSLCIKEPLPSIQVISYQKFTFIWHTASDIALNIVTCILPYILTREIHKSTIPRRKLQFSKSRATAINTLLLEGVLGLMWSWYCITWSWG